VYEAAPISDDEGQGDSAPSHAETAREQACAGEAELCRMPRSRAAGIAESPKDLQLRLKAEIAELLVFAEAAADGSGAVDFGEDPAAILADLLEIGQRLDRALAREEEASKGRTVATPSAIPMHQQLEELAERGAARLQMDAAPSTSGSCQVFPCSTSALSQADSNSISELERGVADLEVCLGAVGALPWQDLQHGVTELEQQLASFDAGKIEGIRRGISRTRGEVERLLEKRAESGSNASAPENFRKATELYEMSSRWSKVAPVLPSITSQLKSLKALHEESASFPSRLIALETQQAELTTLLESTTSSVQRLGKEMAGNLALMRKSMADLNEKMHQRGLNQEGIKA